MASTIKLKRGSGVPTSGSLAAGEPALDLTNNKLYSSTDGTDVVEVGGFDGQFADGSVSSPSITFASDTALGFFKSSKTGGGMEFVQSSGTNGFRLGVGNVYNYLMEESGGEYCSIDTRVANMDFNLNTSSGNPAISFFWNSSLAGSITVNSSLSVNYNTSSDYRLKENIVPIENAVARIDSLNPIRFNFIAEPSKTVDGFLAHEVTPVVPEAIAGEKDAVDDEGNPVYQGIDQSKLVPLLVAAVQELSARVAALEAN